MDSGFSFRWVIFSTGCHNENSYALCCCSVWDRASTEFPLSHLIQLTFQVTRCPLPWQLLFFFKFNLETSLHNQQLSGYVFLFKQHKYFLCPEILELACARGGWKTLASSWKKWLIQGVRLVGGSETCTRSLAVSSSVTTVAGMCPQWARLPGLVVVLPVWILYTGGADWELNFTFHYLFARHCNEWSHFSTNNNDTSVFDIYFIYCCPPPED